MAIKLEDKPNVEAPSTDYEFGNIKDNPGNNSGTPVNALVYADFHQFFAKLMASAGISYNGLPDNTTNDYQYFLALIKAIDDEVKLYEDLSGDITLHANITSSTVVCYKWRDNTVMLRVVATISGIIPVFSDLISGLTSAPSTSNVIASFRNTGTPNNNYTQIALDLGSTKISNRQQIDPATYDRISIYLIYKIE